MTPRIVLAKYVPDLGRMEPRNIGVFLWSRGELRARFLEAADATFINEQKTYARWQEFWTSMIGSESIRPRRGRPVPRKEPTCVDALISTQDGNYLLVDAGEMIEPVGKRDIAKAVDFLFKELVAPTRADAAGQTAGFKTLCDALFSQAMLTEREDYQTKFPVLCGLFGQKRPLHFSYGFGTAKDPLAVFQRVNLSNEMSVNNAALILHEVSDQTIVPREKCAALVQESAITSKAAESGHKWLSQVCTVIDVESKDAVARLGGMVPVPQVRAAL